jgi:hypothetical protein
VFPSPCLKAEPIISPASPFKLKIVQIDLLKPDPLLVYKTLHSVGKQGFTSL